MGNAVVPSSLASAGTLDGDEEFHVVDDPSGTPTSKKTTPDAILTRGESTFLKLNASNDPVTESLTIAAEQLLISNAAVDEQARLRLSNDAQTYDLVVDGASFDRFEIVDQNGVTTPFRIEPGASNNSLYIDSNGRVGIGTGTPKDELEVSGATGVKIRVNSTGAGASFLELDCEQTAAGIAASRVQGKWSGNTIGRIEFRTGDDTTNKDEGDILFLTANGGFLAERMRIHQEGVVTIASKLEITASGPTVNAGSGTPEGAVTAPIGSLFMRSDGGAGTSLYVKESGTGNTGWVAK